LQVRQILWVKWVSVVCQQLVIGNVSNEWRHDWTASIDADLYMITYFKSLL